MVPSSDQESAPAKLGRSRLSRLPNKPAILSRSLPRAPWLRPPRGGLWRHADFTRLWAAQSISAVGSQVSLLALPLIAVLTLEASPFAVGVLGFVGGLPVLLIGLIAGVWVDRLRRRPLMIAADLGRAILLLTIPIAWWQGALSMSLLCVVTLLTGLLSVLFDVSFLSYLPTLVSRDALVEGNSKLEASASSSQVVGPGLAGWLVGVAGAPVALVLDAASFLASALFLTRIQAPEPASPPAADRASLWTEMKDGVRLVRQSRILAALVACGATTSFSAWIFYAVYVLYMTRELGLTAEAVGLVFATGGAGALAGAMLAGPVRRRFGVGPTLVGGQLFFGLTGLFVPLALFVPSIALEIVVATEFLQWLGVIVYDINAVSLRQAITPRGAEGRVNATSRFLAWGVRPFGSLLGGLLGGLIGLPWTLVVGEIGIFLAVFWLIWSPIPKLQELPRAASE